MTHTLKSIFALAALASVLAPSGANAQSNTPLSNGECSSHVRRNSNSSKVPFKDADFRWALSNTRTLQWPDAANACLRNRDLKYNGRNRASFINNRFFLDRGRLIFNSPNPGINSTDAQTTTRMELRGNSFASVKPRGKSEYKVWEATFKIPNWKNSDHSSRFTIGQLFSERDGRPVLRLEFRRISPTRAELVTILADDDRNDTIRTNKNFVFPRFSGESTSHTVKWVYNRDSKNISVRYNGEWYGIAKAGKFRANRKNWYFKAGVYNHDYGKFRVDFTNLRFAGSD